MATGKQIRHYREKLGCTLQQLSDVCDVDVGTISALEVRDSSRSKFFAPIAKAFGLTVEQLADEQADHPAVLQKRLTADPIYTHRQEHIPPPSAQEHIANPFTPKSDVWTQAALEIMRDLDEGQRQAMVAKMREYKQYLGPPYNGQTLRMAG